MRSEVEAVTASFNEVFSGIMFSKPEIEANESTWPGRVYMRIKFRIWPGRRDFIKDALKADIMASLKALNPEYADCMATINNEISDTTGGTQPYGC